MKTINKIMFSAGLSLCISTSVLAQQDIAASGGEASGTGGTVSYTLGQVDYITVTGSNNTITQGVQQPSEIFSLPVQLLYFTGHLSGKQTLLEWATASEFNNSHFDLERSANATSYNLLATITAKGNSNNKQYYRYTDQAPFNGPTYYRLKQVDLDNHYTYSQVVVVRLEPLNSVVISVYPNPVQTQMNILINSPGIKTYQLILVDMSGKVVSTMKTYCNQGYNIINWNIGNLAAGMYTLTSIDSRLMNTSIIKN